MLRNLKSLYGFRIHATDGNIGTVHDIFFDADQWTIRYFVVDTGPWLLGRHVLISPVAVKEPEWESHTLPVDLMREQVKNSPDVAADRPVSRQDEIAHHDYYRWPYYWAGAGGFIGLPPEAYVAGITQPTIEHETPGEAAPDGDPYLHSARAVDGYKIGATDDDFGSVEDFLIEDGSWIIRYLVLDTGGFLQTGRKVLIGVPWIEHVSWRDSKVFVDLPRAKIEASPEFTPGTVVDREYEERLHRNRSALYTSAFDMWSTGSTKSGCTSTTVCPSTGGCPLAISSPGPSIGHARRPSIIEGLWL